jgi:hypothetical protein
MTTFAETIVNFSDGQTNVVQLPDSKMSQGFIPETASARGEALPAQWLNWLFRTVFRHLNRDKVGTATGLALFTTPDSVIELTAFDRANPTRYLKAVGYKPVSGVHTLVVTGSSVLTLGTPTVDGNQPINGGTDVVVAAYSRQFGDL